MSQKNYFFDEAEPSVKRRRFIPISYWSTDKVCARIVCCPQQVQKVQFTDTV